MYGDSGRYMGRQPQQPQRPASAVVAGSPAAATRGALRPPSSARAPSSSASARAAAGPGAQATPEGRKRFSMYMQAAPGAGGRPATARLVRSSRPSASGGAAADWDRHSDSDDSEVHTRRVVKLSSAPARRMNKLLEASSDARDRLSDISRRQRYTAPFGPALSTSGLGSRHSASARPAKREVRRRRDRDRARPPHPPSPRG